MGLFNRIRNKYDVLKINSQNKQRIRALEAMLKELDESVIKHLTQETIEKIVQQGKTKEFCELYNNQGILPLENCVYSSLIATFCTSIEGIYKRGEIGEEEWKQVQPLIQKYKELIERDDFGALSISRGGYSEFISDLEKFSDEYPRWWVDGGRMTAFQKLIEDGLNLTLIEEKVKSIEDFIEKIHGEEEFLIRTNFEKLTPYKFEEYISNLFELMGYQTRLTPRTRDMGIDVIAVKGDETIAIQVKRYKPEHKVGNRDVQMLLGAMQLKNVKANKGILITTSDFTDSAWSQAEDTPVELWNKERLRKVIREHQL